MHEAGTYLDVTSGPFRLALRTGCVVAVSQDLPLASPPRPVFGAELASVMLRSQRLPLVCFPSGPTRNKDQPVAFVVAVEATGRTAALAADRVSYLHGLGTSRLAVPRFGMERPDLFEGAVRHHEHLLLLLSADALCSLATGRG